MTDPAEMYALLVPGEMPWQDRARCAEVGGEVFFPGKREPCEPANRICRACEVREPCLEYALGRDGLLGVWGGLSERERRELKRQARTERAA